MMVTEKQLRTLQDIQEKVTILMHDYSHTDADYTLSVEKGLGDLAEQLNRLVSMIIDTVSIVYGELTQEDYEAAYRDYAEIYSQGEQE